MNKLTLFSLLAFLLAGCATSPTPALIPAAPTFATTPGLNLTPSPVPLATAPARTPPPVDAASTLPAETPTSTPTAASAPVDTITPAKVATNTPSRVPISTSTPPSQVPLTFTITPRTTQRLGDRLTLTWQSGGDLAELCPLFGSGPGASGCVSVPPSGTRTLAVDESMLPYIGYALRVTSGTTDSWATATVVLGCQGLRNWFFPNPPARCPAAPVETSEAAAQPFEHGLMIWTKTRDRFYAFFNGDASQPQVLEFASQVDLKPGASPDHRVGGAPAGRIEPVSGFGMLWRDEFVEFSNVRARTGWGLLPEFAYTSSYQCELSSGPGLWICYLGVPDNKVLQFRPDSTAQLHILWRQWP